MANYLQAKRSLNFEINFNNKFLCFNFIIVDNEDLKDLEIGDVVQIKIRKQHFCYCEVIDKKKLALDEIIVQGLYLLDMGCSEKEYREYWKKETNLSVLFFKKITQLNLFNS